MNENENKQDKEDAQIQSMYGETPDISLPDSFMLPPEQEEVENTYINDIEDNVDVSFKFAFVGAGQGGGRIVETFNKLGYNRVAAVNTAEQDLNTLNLEEKNKLLIGEGGAGKDRSVAREAYGRHKEDCFDFLRYSFGENFDRIFVCAGAGGGSGSGMLSSLVDTAHELQTSLECSSSRVGVILALPKNSEGKKVNSNAFHTLEECIGLVNSGKISPLIIVDNEKVGKLYPNLPVAKFWEASNSSIAGLLHLFNLTSSKDSSYSSFDPNDFKQVLDCGLIAFGSSPVKNWKDPVNISRIVRENIKGNLLVDGVDIHTGSSAGIIAIGSQEVLDNLPQKHLDQAFGQLSRILKPGSVVHTGIYSGDYDGLVLFGVIGGLNKPSARINDLKKSGDLL